MDKTVKLATKPKRAAPKAKYIDPIVQASFANDGSLGEVTRTLAQRIIDENGTVALKALIVVHTLLRSGELNTTYSLLSTASLPLSNFPTSRTRNVAPYASYLQNRLKSYSNLHRDVVRDKSDRRAASRLRNLTVDKGLLREVREVQRQIASLVEAKFYLDDIDDDVAMTALRLLVKDLLVLFTAVNEGVINVLEHYFEMSHVDATTALKVYKTFCKDMEKVVAYLAVAKKLHNVIQIPIPNLKHAPVSLGNSLEEYLNSPDFEKNREEYKENKRIADGGAPRPQAAATTTTSEAKATTPAASSTAPAAAPKANNQAFTDFFDSIEQSQTTMFNPQTGSPTTFNGAFNFQQQQQTGFNPFMAQSQSGGMSPFGPGPFGGGGMMMGQPTGLVPQATGMGYAAFGGGQPNPFGGMPQQQQQPFLAPQPTGSFNPFRQSMLMAQPTGFAQQQQPLNQYGAFGASAPLPFQGMSAPAPSGPFAAPAQLAPTPTGFPAASNGPFGQQQQPSPFAPQPLPPTQRSLAEQTQAQPAPVNLPPALQAQPTGSKNPFAAAGAAQVAASATPPPPKPSMNDLAFQAFNNSYNNQQQSQPQTNGTTSPSPAPLQPQHTNFMGNIASEFSFSNGSPSPAPPAASVPRTSSPLAAFSSLSVSTAPTGGAAFSPSAPSPLRAQPTGFGGSMVKPFQPSSSFGTSLASELGPARQSTLPPMPESSSSFAASPTGNGPAFNPFRASSVGPAATGSQQFSASNPAWSSSLSTPFSAGGTSFGSSTPLQSQPTGFGNAFGGGAPFSSAPQQTGATGSLI